MSSTKRSVVRTPLFPLYSEVRQLVQILTGIPKEKVSGLLRALFEQTGTPQANVDWSQPDQWISARLHGSAQELANKIWAESKKTVNPRHIYGAYLFINTFSLLLADDQGVYQITTTGKGFVAEDPDILRKLDEEEGLPQLLTILAARSPAKRGDLLDEWSEFLLLTRQ